MRVFLLSIGLTLVASAARGQQSKAVDDAVLKNAGKTGTEWLSYGLTPGETRYSPLNQINAANVSRLGLAWSYDIGQGGGSQEATPLVWNGTIYSITNWSVVYAVDARTGKERWRWDPQVNRTALAPVLCCGAVLRGLAIYEGKIIAPILDGRLDALDAETGKALWEARVAFSQDIYTITMAPRIAKGKVIIGVAGGEYPTRGFFAAYDANTGQFAWKFYTVPGDPSKPFENEAMKKAAATWTGEWWKTGGGAPVWDAISYDPEANLLYVGTGNAGPWAESARGQKASDGKDNLYACSILAVNPDNGTLKWYYQAVPGDEWDFDSVQQIVLADITIKGQMRKVLMQAGKNGFYYVIDRLTGKFISGQPFVQVNWAKGLNEANGRPIFNSEAFYGADSVAISPGAGGAHNWSPMSYSPATGWVYIPVFLQPFTYATASELKPNTNGYSRGNVDPKLIDSPAIGPPSAAGMRGAIQAWDPVNQRLVWRVEGGGGIGGGTVATAGNLVFQVINDGRFRALTADKGDILYEIKTGRTGMAPPVTFEVDGKQYIAFQGGLGRPATTEGPNDAPVDNPPIMFAFALDGTAELPKPAPPPPPNNPPKPAAPEKEP
jgi:quinohemoprotein ethanol dehydrogenase